LTAGSIRQAMGFRLVTALGADDSFHPSTCHPSTPDERSDVLQSRLTILQRFILFCVAAEPDARSNDASHARKPSNAGTRFRVALGSIRAAATGS
jgi:hypothetical protein